MSMCSIVKDTEIFPLTYTTAADGGVPRLRRCYAVDPYVHSDSNAQPEPHVRRLSLPPTHVTCKHFSD